MENSAETLEKAAVTLERYKKNKTRISPADLAGKYKVSFDKLKRQLKEELEAYLKMYCIEQLVFVKDDKGYFEEFAGTVNRIFSDSGMAKRVGKAAFKEFDLEKVKHLAEELRVKVYEEAWVPYFEKHICLFASAECWGEDNPQTPRIYNSLVDKFWSEENGEWIKDEAAKVPAVLIYIQEGKQHEQK